VLRAIVVLSVLAGACSPSMLPPVETPDAGPDAGVPDSGVPDAGPGCGSPLSTPDMMCGALGWVKADVNVTPRNHHLTDVYTNEAGTFLYALGGFRDEATVLRSVQRAQVNPDGSLGLFLDDTELPVGSGGAVGGVLGNVIIFAGGNSASGNLSKSWFSTIQADGTLGAWQAGGDIGNKRMHAGSFIHGDTLYLLGGFNDPNVWDDVVKATVTNGMLSAWMPAGKLPGPRSHFSISAAGDYVYIAGGLDQSAYQNPPNLAEVQRGRVNESGEVGEWTMMPALPVALATQSSFIYGGYLYVAGGEDGAAMEKRVWRASIQADHSLGSWEDAAPLPVARGHVHNLPVLGTHVYSVAGATDAFLDSTGDVQIGTFQ
jgi:hypothetical protein